jgi:4'-phosphopantetheinyl transferase
MNNWIVLMLTERITLDRVDTETVSGGGGVALWHIPLANGTVSNVIDPLNPEERARLAAFKVAEVARRRRCAHSAMRLILGEVTGVAPESVPIECTSYGKPVLAPGHPFSSMAFNLSHSGDWAWLAITKHGKVGVDIEQVKDDLDWQSLANSVCSARESAWISSLAGETKAWGFIRIWTRKEALLKADGCGLRTEVPLSSIDVLADTVVMPPTGSSIVPRRWFLRSVAAAPGYAAALAASYPPHRIVSRDWIAPQRSVSHLSEELAAGSNKPVLPAYAQDGSDNNRS